MRRSLLIRLLGLSLAVAVFSIAATAWLTTRDTSERLAGEFEETLSADNFVYQSLLGYAENHDSWQQVDATLDQLAERVGARIVLTEPDGTMIADSAASGGDSAPLPQNPVARIDVNTLYGPAQPLLVAGESVITSVPEEGFPTDEEVGATMAFHPSAVDPNWRLTKAELTERRRLSERASACLRDEFGPEVEVVLTPDGALTMSSDGQTEFLSPAGGADAGGGPGTEEPVDVAGTDCVPPELTAASDAARTVNEREAEQLTACLSDANLDHRLATDPSGLKVVLPTDATASPEWDECAISARSKALEPFVADPAVLYTGSSDRFDALSGDGWWRTALAGLAVLAVAAGVTVFAGRRLTRPIRALTAAVRRMGHGDRTARVPISGHDEVAQLGQAFNAMAESVAKSEDQRRAMVGDIAHELRTPLANVRGYLEAAEDGVVPLDRALVSSLLEESALLQHLIDDLQDLALADAGALRMHREACDAADLARQAVAAHQTSATDAGITLVAAEPEPVAVDVDPRRIRQALSNLVANAVQYTPSGGEVRVDVRRDGDTAVLTVSDNGPGIAPEHLPRLFDRFYRTDTSRTRATGGSGLGLAITKHLVEAHEGSVEVTSTEGVGSVFTIRLPVRSLVATGS